MAVRDIQVRCGDCLKLLPRLEPADFLFADPPFNIDQPYVGYRDMRPDYESFTFQWIKAAWDNCNGVLALHGPDHLAEFYLEAARKLNMDRIAWINWHFRFGPCRKSNWIDTRTHCLLFAKRKDHVWNPDDVSVASDRTAVYNDKRCDADDERFQNGGTRLPGSVWGVPSDGKHWGRVTKTNKERRAGHPNQLPELYLERLIRAYTNPGQLVIDPFGGSGTTAVVAKALSRRCITTDISKLNCDSIRDRLKTGAVRVKKRGL